MITPICTLKFYTFFPFTLGWVDVFALCTNEKMLDANAPPPKKKLISGLLVASRGGKMMFLGYICTQNPRSIMDIGYVVKQIPRSTQKSILQGVNIILS